MTRFDLVIFDWDGTLVDSTRAIAESIRLAAADLGLNVPTEDQASHVIGLGLADALRLTVPDLPQSRLQEYIARYRVHYLEREGRLSPFPGVAELLRDLAGAQPWLAIATGKSRVGLNSALSRTDWAGHFITTRCADEGAPKPDPWMLRDICAELGVEPQRAVMIGDTTHDMMMARAAGAASVAVTYGAHRQDKLLEHGCDACVGSVAELRGWLWPRLAAAGG